MSANIKRPIWVWFILVWFSWPILDSLHILYGVLSGSTVMSSNTFGHIQAFSFQALTITASILLILRKEIAKWFFSIFFCASTFYMSHMVFFGEPILEYKVLKITLSFSIWFMYGLMAWYTFKLKTKGYYIAKNT